MIHIRLQLFAVVREALGCDALDLTLPDGATVGDVRRELAKRAPRLTPAIAHFSFAVDREYALDSRLLQDDCEVACIPPVSGG
jgi:molybdopterin converting factor subunit 1